MKRLLSNSTKNHNPQGSIKYLFGLHGLTQPSDFQKITNQTLLNVKKHVNKLEQESIKLSSSNHKHSPKTDPHKLLYLLDCISNELCKVIDVAEIVRNIHYNNDFKQAAEESFATLSNTVHDLNTNNTIYNIITILLNKHISILNEEEIMFLTDMKREYKNEGIHLPNTHKQTLINLQNNIVSIETDFMNNTINDNTIFPIYNVPKHNITYVREWLQKFVLQNDPNFGFQTSTNTSYDSTNSKSNSNNSNSVLCTSNKRISLILLKSLQNEDNRRDLYYNIYLQPYNNIYKLGQLIQYRQNLAYIVNKISYTHKFLEKQAIKTPLNVVNVLEHLSDLTRPKAESELYQLQKLKNTLTNSSNNNNSILYPWDISYYTAVYASINKEFKKETSVTYTNTNSTNSIRSEKQQLQTLSSYFSLYHTIKGILLIIYELFNIQFILQPLDSNEKWTETENNQKSGFFNFRPDSLFNTTSSSSGSNNSSNDNNTYSSSSNNNSSNSNSSKEDDLIYDSIRNGVFKYNVYDLSISKDALIGTVYIDIYQRKGKFPGMYIHITMCIYNYVYRLLCTTYTCILLYFISRYE